MDSPADVSHAHHPIYFEEFFELGLHETVSPFLKPSSRKWGAYLTLKSALLAALLLILSFALSFYPATQFISYFALILVYFLAGIPSLIESIQDLVDFEINIDILMTLAAFSSFIIGSGMEGALLLVLFALSGSIEDAVTSRAKNSISSLNKLSPTKATVLEVDGTLIERALADIQVGTKILVKAGQIVPLDGIVVEGISSVNLVHLTGENLPLTKKVGDEVSAGGRNLEGALVLNVTQTSTDSTLAKIIQLVTQAQEARPHLQRWFDRLSRSYAIAIILLAGFFALSFPFLFHIPFLGIEGSVYRALAFLIAASPCALIIALPIAYLSAISVCARKGILLKGGIVLDALASCSCMAFDKTGTLTTGELTCEGIEQIDPLSKEEENHFLSIAHAMERNAVHPIARSILQYAQQLKIPAAPLTEFKATPGYGLVALANGIPAYMGHPDLIFDKLTPKQKESLIKKIEAIQSKGELIAVMLYGSKVALFRFHDTLRPQIRQTLKALHQWNMETIMLTGDHVESAQRIAKEAGMDQVHANLRPEDKLNWVINLSEKRGLAMIGDGINDAPALARATVGIAMGKVGSTAAIDAADIVLLHDNIDVVDWLVAKAHQTEKVVKQNLAVAVLAILIASIPSLIGLVPLWLAVVMHEGGTVLVGLNALRLLRK